MSESPPVPGNHTTGPNHTGRNSAGPNPTVDNQLPIAVDAMGGDLGSSVVVEGVVKAANEFGVNSVLVGREDELQSALDKLAQSNPNLVSIIHAPDVVEMSESPTSVIRSKPNCSIRRAFELVKQGVASAVVSPGNTGAVMAAGLYVSGVIPGVARPAIASLIPRVGKSSPTVLLDSGANVDCHASQLVQFALMGNFYANSALGNERPRIALLSNGTESSKGNDIIRAAAQMLTRVNNLNFVGYIEGRDISRDIADVVVCDGFVGNIALKSMEGTVELVLDSIKYHVERSLRGRFGIWIARPLLRSLFRDKLDPSAYGGAPLLGLNEIAIICHGSSSARAIMNAVRVAHKFTTDGLVDRISSALTSLDLSLDGDFQDGIWNRAGERFTKRKVAVEEHEKKEPDLSKVE